SETKSIANINRSLLEGENGSNGLEGQAYSILLRLRGVYIIKCLLAGKLHSNRGFREFVLGNSKVDYGSIYLAYKNVKAGSKLKVKLKASDLIMLLEVLGREAGRLA
ncbi:MAG: hypothetical protein HY519_01670, partial [Candidatus Aenigmarchaeota archaeon]|nr:hypothetical protein [Candidatus Aenigmarchaeota archaeon]